MIYAGCDTGKFGAIALYNTETKEMTIHDFPLTKDKKEIDTEALYNLTKEFEQPVLFCIEAVHSFPNQSSRSTFSQGKNYGIALTVPGMLQCPVALCTPAKWKKAMGVGRAFTGEPKKALKERAIAKAKELFPEHEKFFMKSKDGRAEAALICKYIVEEMERERYEEDN